MVRLLVIGLATLAMLLASAASAHKPSDSYLSLAVDEQRVTGRWDIALRDLEHAIGLDRDGNGAITWGEVKAGHGDIAAYALARLELSSAGSVCVTSPVEDLIVEHSDGAYAVLRFTGDCPAAIDALDVRYSLLFDLDPLHRGLGQVQSGDLTQTSVFSPERSTWHVRTGSANLGQQIATYVREGVWHIWVGLDHILFLLCLLLPAARRRGQGAREPSQHSSPPWIEVVQVVTSFTVAHSITLSLAALGILSFPARLVESAIAASVVFAALNNIRPMVTERLWLIAFGFGLVHGLGFASVLADLALPRHTLLLALLGFNLGVEVGQLVLVGLFFGVVWASGRLDVVWPQWATPLPACVIAIIAGVWFIERAFGVALAG
jgi:HupE / UreJ protein